MKITNAMTTTNTTSTITRTTTSNNTNTNHIASTTTNTTKKNTFYACYCTFWLDPGSINVLNCELHKSSSVLDDLLVQTFKASKPLLSWKSKGQLQFTDINIYDLITLVWNKCAILESLNKMFLTLNTVIVGNSEA